MFKGGIKLSQSDYDRLERVDDGKHIYYVLHSQHKNRVDINKENFEELVKKDLNLEEVVNEIKTTQYYLRKFLVENYKTNNFKEVKLSLLTTRN